MHSERFHSWMRQKETKPSLYWKVKFKKSIELYCQISVGVIVAKKFIHSAISRRLTRSIWKNVKFAKQFRAIFSAWFQIFGRIWCTTESPLCRTFCALMFSIKLLPKWILSLTRPGRRTIATTSSSMKATTICPTIISETEDCQQR